MNQYAYSIENLRQMIRDLEKENRELKEKLKSYQIPFDDAKNVIEKHDDIAYDEDQGERIVFPKYINAQMVQWFLMMFHGRADVYAKHGKKGGYFPQCQNFWGENCPKKQNQKQSCTE